jgi:hypothetical protein
MVKNHFCDNSLRLILELYFPNLPLFQCKSLSLISIHFDPSRFIINRVRRVIVCTIIDICITIVRGVRLIANLQLCIMSKVYAVFIFIPVDGMGVSMQNKLLPIS